jgi:hypothetical protein
MGFGSALLFYFPLSLIENVIWTVVILIRGEGWNSIRALLLGTLGISFISSLIALGLIGESPWGPVVLWPLIITSFWAWYFAFIPQLLIRTILSRCCPDRRPRKVLWRIVLTVVLPAVLYLAHGLLGIISGMPSD